MTEEKKRKDPEFGGYWHVRMLTGFELIGALYWVETKEGTEKPLLFRPVRVKYEGSGDGLGVRFAPYSMFSDEDFFPFDISQTEFLVEMNDRSAYRYEEFCEQYEEAMASLYDGDDEEEAVSTPPSGSVIH